MKDGTVYTFNQQNKLESAADRYGNETRYVYDSQGRLARITDPVGLETHFAYVGNRVGSITDPAGRVTRLEHDGAGRLERIIDPDGSVRRFDYDGNHMTGETDKNGNHEQATYDFAGRVKSALRADGSTIEITPLQTRTLYPPSATIDPGAAPPALTSGGTSATYTYPNGNVTVVTLDERGQVLSRSDSLGTIESIARDEQGRAMQSTTGEGRPTFYTYDDAGNVLSIRDELSERGTTMTYEPLLNQRTSVTDELGRQTLFEVDAFGNTFKTTQVVAARTTLSGRTLLRPGACWTPRRTRWARSRTTITILWAACRPLLTRSAHRTRPCGPSSMTRPAIRNR
jgi:YD repeat-containing protein